MQSPGADFSGHSAVVARQESGGKTSHTPGGEDDAGTGGLVIDMSGDLPYFPIWETVLTIYEGQGGHMQNPRDATVDVLRGLAVFTMIPANMSATVYAEPHDFWFRVFGSFAAPLFVLLSGYMVAVNMQAKNYGVKYYLIRGGMLLAIAALIDLAIWRIIPFMTYDVLYVTAVSMPLVYLFRNISSAWLKWGIIAGIIAAAPLLVGLLGYADYPTEIYLNPNEQVELPANKSGLLGNLFIDGWFPVFPWLALSFIGSMLADLRKRQSNGVISLGRWSYVIGLVVLVAGLGAWWQFPGQMLVREGYSELFYPPTVGYVLTAVGLIVLLFVCVNLRPNPWIFQPLRTLGEAALAMYILHLALTSYLFSKLFPDRQLGVFLMIALLVILACISVGIGVRRLKRTWTNRPMVARFLLGG